MMADDTTRNDPIHEDEKGWWFWDEAWADRHGPYLNEASAREMMRRYGIEVLGEAAG